MNAAGERRIHEAIDAAQHGTTGRIAVRIVSGKTADALDDARKHFFQAHMHEHEHRNAVIFFVAPKARRFAVFGDKAIHDHVGDAFWASLVDGMKPYFAQGEMAEGLVYGIDRVGEQLRTHFPARAVVAKGTI